MIFPLLSQTKKYERVKIMPKKKTEPLEEVTTDKEISGEVDEHSTEAQAENANSAGSFEAQTEDSVQAHAEEETFYDELDTLEAMKKPSENENDEESPSEDSQPPEEETEESVEKVRMYSLSNKMRILMNSAIYNREIMTGELVSVVNIKGRGVIATVIYNGSSDDLRFDSATVKIPAENMGIDLDAINNYIKRSFIRRKIHLTPSTFRIQQRHLQYVLLSSMLGAKVDFIPTEINEDTNAIIGNRKMAMEVRRKDLFPTRYHPVPQYQVGSRYRARILRVTPISLVVDVSGFEVTMNAAQITPMAVDISEHFKVGDSIWVIIREITDKGVTVISSDANSVDVRVKVNEYRLNEVVKARVYYHNPRTGMYYIRMPNGCRGLVYFTKSSFYYNPRVGDNVRVRVVGRTPNGNAVRCQIKGVI